MKKEMLLIILCIMILPFVSALTIEKTNVNNVVAKELSEPAKFLFKITNGYANPDNFEFYTLINAQLSPKGTVIIGGGETKNIDFYVYPSDRLKDEVKGTYTFVYYVKSSQEGIKEDRIVIKILPLKDILEIEMPESISFDTSEFTVTFRNNESIVLNNIEATIDSPFSKTKEAFSLNPLEEKKITVKVDNSKLRGLVAGNYIVTFTLRVNNEATIKLEKGIAVTEISNIATTEKEAGNFLVPVLIITKKNNGNVLSVAEIIVKKSAFSKAFTTFSINPSGIERKGLTYIYSWSVQLRPQEAVSLEVKTNYVLPIIILIVIAIVVVFIVIATRTRLVVKKKVLRVRTKGGEFAFKSVVIVKAKSNVSNIVVRERMPKLTELHERFGTIRPDRIDTTRKMLEWDINEMKAGEEKVFSYIAYSRVSILGRFELPKTHATYTYNGKTKYIMSNSVYLLAEEKAL